ncbi:hypothetical protein B0H34DRAFT_738044 [Crassisporium funariophilum]|nr:hypothetical protein B0H34DRAFT_738044 [Crassisporium funariophilum]
MYTQTTTENLTTNINHDEDLHIPPAHRNLRNRCVSYPHQKPPTNNTSSSFFLLHAEKSYADVTLHEISRTKKPTTTTNIKVVQSGTTNVYPVGTGTDGKTTYVQDNIVSLYVIEYPVPTNPSVTTTTTLISKPETVVVTFAEDKSGYHASRAPSHLPNPSSTVPGAVQAGLDESCTFNA